MVIYFCGVFALYCAVSSAQSNVWISKPVLQVNPITPNDPDCRVRTDVHATGDFEYWPYIPSETFTDVQPDDPFHIETPLFAEPGSTWSLVCESGEALVGCNNETRPVCDAFCKQQCRLNCSSPLRQDQMAECLIAHDMADCSFNVFESLWIPTSICRTVIDYEVTPQFATSVPITVYLSQPDWGSLPLANFKRLKKATLSIPLTDEYSFAFAVGANEFSESELKIAVPKDMGNLIRATDGLDIATCDIDMTKLPFTVADLEDYDYYRTEFGALYNKREGGVGEAPYTYDNDVTKLMQAASLQVLGGLPKQLMVWWPGTQPNLFQTSELALGTDFTTEGFLKIMYQLPPTRFFTSRGFHTMTMDHATPARTLAVSCVLVALVIAFL